MPRRRRPQRPLDVGATPPAQVDVGVTPPAQVVGNAFVQQYYNILHQSPEMVHLFYQDASLLGRPSSGAAGDMDSITTVEAIGARIMAMDMARAEIRTVDSQESLDGGLTVLVAGHLTSGDGVRRGFSQSFFLAGQERGYFVLNDMFRYVGEGPAPAADAAAAPLANGTTRAVVGTSPPERDAVPQQEQHVVEEQPVPEDDDLRNKLQNNMEEGEGFKKEASDKLLRLIKSERMAVQKQKETEKFLSRAQQELEQLKIQKDEVSEELQKANDHNEYLQGQLSESREHYDRLLSEHEHLLHERDSAVREAEELRQRRGQKRSVLVTAMPCDFSSSDLECATENFSSSLKIGEGGFGCMYRGVIQNKKVAIKVLRPDILQSQSQFEQEVAILSRVRHPNLVTLVGACLESSTLVYEFLPNGSLEDFLVCANKRHTLLWHIRVRIIAEICSALIFLHKNKPHPVVHGDLKPANILLDVNLVSKLSDFGISRLLIHSSSNNTTLYRTIHPAGTPIYMDPEFFATGELTPLSDVYSFGIVVLRLLTGRSPIGIKKLVEDAMAGGNLSSVIDTSAGEWPDVHVYQLAHLALQCTELSSRCRPDLSGEVWGAVEAMRDAAASSLPSSSRPVLNEIFTPSYFICPINQDVMNDPHIAADGFTYEAEAIRSWLGTGSGTSPMTNLPLQHNRLIPNHALRSAIQEWLQLQNMER